MPKAGPSNFNHLLYKCQRSKFLSNLLIPQVHYQVAGLETEQLGPEPMMLCDTSVTTGCLTFCATMLVPQGSVNIVDMMRHIQFTLTIYGLCTWGFSRGQILNMYKGRHLVQWLGYCLGHLHPILKYVFLPSISKYLVLNSGSSPNSSFLLTYTLRQPL